MFSIENNPTDENITRPECSKSSRFDITNTRFNCQGNNEEKIERKLPSLTKNEENEEISSNIKFTSAQNFHKCQQNFTQGLTLEQYFNQNFRNDNDEEKPKESSLINFNNIKKITEQTEVSFDNSEKKYMDASFEINESDEDKYNNSDSNSNASRIKNSDKKKKKNEDKLGKSDQVIEPKVDEQKKDIKKKIEQKYTKKVIKKHKSQKIIINETMPLKEYEKKNSMKLDSKNEVENNSFQKNTVNQNNDEDNSSYVRENRMKNSNKQPKKIYNSQSPPHTNLVKKLSDRRNFSKDNFSQEEILPSFNKETKENYENHIAYRNSYDPNNSYFLATGHFNKKKEEEKAPNFHNINNDFNRSSYNSKSRLTLNEFYKNQSKYQDFGNPIGPPVKNKWNSVNPDYELGKKYLCDKEKLQEKIKNEDLNLITKYAQKFQLNEEEYKNLLH